MNPELELQIWHMLATVLVSLVTFGGIVWRWFLRPIITAQFEAVYTSISTQKATLDARLAHHESKDTRIFEALKEIKNTSIDQCARLTRIEERMRIKRER